MYNFWRILSVYFVLFLYVSCISSSEKFYIESVDGLWNANEPIRLIVEVPDSEKSRNITLIIRNNKDYKYRNLSLIVSISQLDGNYEVVDKLNYVIAKPSGVWRGMGFGEIKETFGQYKMRYKFPYNAKYEVKIKHLMDADSLVGIEDIGIKIETLKS